MQSQGVCFGILHDSGEVALNNTWRFDFVVVDAEKNGYDNSLGVVMSCLLVGDNGWEDCCHIYREVMI